jgi:acylphosphatase
VFFRASTRAEAVRLRLTGYAKNLADGSVEVLVCGDAAALDELERWLHIGPPAARVEKVLRSETQDPVPSGFDTR